MKIEKNKIVFGSVLLVVVVFIVAYTMMVFGEDDEESTHLRQTLIPDLEQEQADFKSKLDAVNALKEVRETTAPSIYDEKLIDSLGYYDPDLRNKRKERIVDSIYNSGRINYTENTYRSSLVQEPIKNPDTIELLSIEEKLNKTSPEELGLEHQLFYSSIPQEKAAGGETESSASEYFVEVDGDQVVRAGYRLRMRLTEAAIINGMFVPQHTPVYGFVRFQPNRALIVIENINHYPVDLKAYDLQDGSEGIYVVNSMRSDASREVLDDIIQDIDIPGVPQVGGIKQVFQRNNRNIKVTVTNNYKLILKASQGQ